MIRKVYGIALVMGLALSLGGGVGCGDSNSGGKGGSGGSTGGSGGSGGTGGIGGSAGCPGTQRCGRVLDCACIEATCNEDTGAWECPSGYPLDRCPSESECDVENNGVYGDCSMQRMPGGKKRGLGACCTQDAANDDCAPGYQCFNGYCASGCDTDADCGGGDFGVQTPSPFAEGSKLHCVQTSAGGWCMAGSGKACKTPTDCDANEICTFTMSNANDGSGSNICLAAYATATSKDVGEACDQGEPYDCKAPTTIAGSQLFFSCFSGQCSAGCDPNTPDACGEGRTCLAVITTVQGAVAGICGGADCGFSANLVNFNTPRVDRIEPGACPEGQFCDFGTNTGTGQQLMCTPNDPEGTQMAGDDCQADAKLDLQCAEGYCIQRQPPEGTQTCTSTANCLGENEICVDSNGDNVGHCATAGPPGKCGLLCASDAQCFDGSYCVQYRNIFRTSNGGTDATDIGICARPDQWFTNFKDLEVCTGEKDCTKVGDSCNYEWARSAFATCGVAAAADRNGGNCTSDNDCVGDLRCVRRVNDAGTAYEFKCTDLSDLKPVGASCSAATECKSQICLDSELRGPAAGRRTMCAAPCLKTADCGDNMACVTVTQIDNSTEAAGDDSLVGFCLPRGPSTTKNACAEDADCRIEGVLCEKSTGQCYDSNANLGDPCNGDDRCPEGSVCEIEDRICVIAGCDPANDTCPEGTACLKGRGPVYNCQVP